MVFQLCANGVPIVFQWRSNRVPMFLPFRPAVFFRRARVDAMSSPCCCRRGLMSLPCGWRRADST
eukprot:5270469-Lingulodinium_polyedra.AAC.1